MDMIEKPRSEAGDEPRMRADARRSRAKLLEAATAAFAENGADAPLEDIARRAGVGIGTLYRHFPTRTDLQAGVFRSQVDAVCSTADNLIGAVSPEQAFAGSVRAIAAYLITKHGLAKALIDSLGRDSELISVCSLRMRDTLDRLLDHAQQAGAAARRCYRPGRAAPRARHRHGDRAGSPGHRPAARHDARRPPRAGRRPRSSRTQACFASHPTVTRGRERAEREPVRWSLVWSLRPSSDARGAVLVGGGEDHRGARGHVRERADLLQQVLKGDRGGDAYLEDVVLIACDAVAGLDRGEA